MGPRRAAPLVILLALAAASPLAAQTARHPARGATAGGPGASSHPGADPGEGAEVGEPGRPPASKAAARGSIVRTVVPVKDGMLLIPGQRFTMGSGNPRAPYNERPAHPAQIAPFWMDRTEVTVGAYRACVDAGKCAPPAKSSPLCTWDMGDDQLPVSCVHWSDADDYCRFAGKRLPHEAEWEFAARGRRVLRYPWGGRATTCAYATTLLHEATARGCARKPSRVGTHPAGASPFGVLDLSGNVEEWTSDWYVAREASGVRPSSGSAHVLRGGGWLSPPSASRTTSRDWGSALEAGPNVGFRCARDPDASGPSPPK